MTYEHRQSFNALVAADRAHNLLRALLFLRGGGYHFTVFHGVGNHVIGCLATRTLVPVTLSVLLPFAGKIMSEPGYRLSALLIAQSARIGKHAVFRTRCGNGRLAFVPHMLALTVAAVACGKSAHYGSRSNCTKHYF